MRFSPRPHVTWRVCGTPVTAPNGRIASFSEGAWGRIGGLGACATTLTLGSTALAWFFPLPVSAPQYRAFDEYLLPQPAWRELRETQPVPVAVATTCETYLE